MWLNILKGVGPGAACRAMEEEEEEKKKKII
jgi:hypothetical protein